MWIKHLLEPDDLSQSSKGRWYGDPSLDKQLKLKLDLEREITIRIATCTNLYSPMVQFPS
jgi:hypothetical protein